MNILITGANGFLGSNFIKSSLKNNNIYAISENQNNLNDVISDIKYTSSNLKNYINHRNDIIKFEPDIIILFGWAGANSYKNINDICQYYDNIPYCIDFLKFINTLKKKPKFIGIGSFSEYGNLEKQISENDYEIPNNFYGLSKLTYKKYSELFCLQNEIEWVWIRPCFIYGPYDVETRLIPYVINKCLNNETIELDECNKIIDYLYIDDFVTMLNKLINTNSTGVYNICSGNQYILRDIIELIVKLTNTNSKIIYNKLLNRTPDNKMICGTNKKIKKIIGDLSPLCIDDGMKKTIEFYAKR
jgi:nucleoside-diphosphate-sugar epimerase